MNVASARASARELFRNGIINTEQYARLVVPEVGSPRDLREIAGLAGDLAKRLTALADLLEKTDDT